MQPHSFALQQLRSAHAERKRKRSEEIKEQTANINENFCFCIRFRLVWTLLYNGEHSTSVVIASLGYIYIKANAKAKATSLPICCIVSNLCVYTTAMCKRQQIKEKICFRFRVRSNVKEPLEWREVKLLRRTSSGSRGPRGTWPQLCKNES